jgi:AcrR family transcriptional regulator
MVRKRFENLDAEAQERIFAAAAAEFAERGYEAASINRILAAAEMSKGSLYYYFEDKADLFAAVVERATAGMLAAAGGLALDDLTAENYWDRLGLLVQRSGEFLSRHDWAARLVRSILRAPGSAASAGVAQAAERWTAAILARGQQLGVIRADLPFAMLASMALALGEAGDRWLLEHWEEFSPAERERLGAGQMDIFRRMLAAVVEQGA